MSDQKHKNMHQKKFNDFTPDPLTNFCSNTIRVNHHSTGVTTLRVTVQKSGFFKDPRDTT